MIRATGALVLASIVFAFGGWLVWSGWRQPRPSVAHAIAHLRRGPARSSGAAAGAASGSGVTRSSGVSGPSGEARFAARIGAFIERGELGERGLVAERTQRWAQTLRLIGRSVDEHVGWLVLGAVAGFVVPSLLLGLAQMLGVVSLALWIPAAVSLVGAVLVPLAVHSDAVARSADVAIDLRHQLGAYLDMVTMLLAGNSGYEGALDQAARAGDGLLFQALRRRMREMATRGRTLVDALDLVADDYGIVELEQVAATATLSAAEGAPVARTLSAKCATLRSTLAAEQEAAARVRVDKVTPPLVGMALLFMALIIYPALDLT